MRKAVLALATTATIGLATLAAPSPAHAWRGGWGPGLAGGLLAGAGVGGVGARLLWRLCPRVLQLRFRPRILWRIPGRLLWTWLLRVQARYPAGLRLRPPLLWRGWVLVGVCQGGWAKK